MPDISLIELPFSTEVLPFQQFIYSISYTLKKYKVNDVKTSVHKCTEEKRSVWEAYVYHALTDSNSATISLSGSPVQRETTTITMQEITNAGNSS